MQHQPVREPRCEHVPTAGASQCRDCQHGPEMATWTEYWAWRRRQLNWWAEPVTGLNMRGAVTSGSRVCVSDPVTTVSISVVIPSTYLWEIIISNVVEKMTAEILKRQDNLVVGEDVPPPNPFLDLIAERIGKTGGARLRLMTKNEALRHALATEEFIIDPLTKQPYKRGKGSWA